MNFRFPYVRRTRCAARLNAFFEYRGRKLRRAMGFALTRDVHAVRFVSDLSVGEFLFDASSGGTRMRRSARI